MVRLDASHSYMSKGYGLRSIRALELQTPTKVKMTVENSLPNLQLLLQVEFLLIKIVLV